MIAVKDNKVYQITDAERTRYAAMGFDIVDDDGKVIAYGAGRTVDMAEYMAVKEELDALKGAAKAKK